MLKKRKFTKKYYFSVEGETEKWYLEWLRDTINAEKDIKAQVALDCKIEKDPISRVKGISGIIAEITIWHLSDYESDSAQHAKQFNILLRFIAWQNEWKHTFTRLFTALRGVIWRCLDMGSVLKCCGTASDPVRMRGAPEQAYLPGFAPL